MIISFRIFFCKIMLLWSEYGIKAKGSCVKLQGFIFFNLDKIQIWSYSLHDYLNFFLIALAIFSGWSAYSWPQPKLSQGEPAVWKRGWAAWSAESCPRVSAKVFNKQRLRQDFTGKSTGYCLSGSVWGDVCDLFLNYYLLSIHET